MMEGADEGAGLSLPGVSIRIHHRLYYALQSRSQSPLPPPYVMVLGRRKSHCLMTVTCTTGVCVCLMRAFVCECE